MKSLFQCSEEMDSILLLDSAYLINLPNLSRMSKECFKIIELPPKLQKLMLKTSRSQNRAQEIPTVRFVKYVSKITKNILISRVILQRWRAPITISWYRNSAKRKKYRDSLWTLKRMYRLQKNRKLCKTQTCFLAMNFQSQ